MPRYGTPSDDGSSPADEFFPPFEEDGIQDETQLEEPINPEWLDKTFKVTGQIAAASIVVGLTSGIVIISLGSIWWLLTLFF